MLTWRKLGAFTIVLFAVQHACAEPTYSICEKAKVDDCFRITLDMTLTGEKRIHNDDKTVPLKLEAKAQHAFQERILLVGNSLPTKVARVYDVARAEIVNGSDRSERTLRPERKLIVAQRQHDQNTTYSPQGALLREELDLTNDNLDTLTLTGLLPTAEVKVGETWKVSNEAVQALCGFEALIKQDLVGKLEEVTEDTARVTITGKVSGIDVGATVNLTIEATSKVNLKEHRLVQLEWNTTDEREQGPVNPASSIKTTTMLKRESIKEPECLGNVALVSIPEGLDVPPSLTQLWHRDPQGRFELNYSRDWQIVAQTKDHLVLRLMDQGDFISQATITPWKSAGKAQHMSPTRFRDVVESTPRWEVEKELEAGEIEGTVKDGWAYRISALGHLDGAPVLQNYYLLAGPNGDQAIVLFTMHPKQADKLGSRDLSLFGGVEFPEAK
jgi:hypothetical protein